MPQDAYVVALLLWRFNAELQTWNPSVDELATRFTGLLGLGEVVVVLAVEREAVVRDAAANAVLGRTAGQFEELYARHDLRG